MQIIEEYKQEEQVRDNEIKQTTSFSKEQNGRNLLKKSIFLDITFEGSPSNGLPF